VAVDELPVGPAQAGIALQAESGACWLTLAVRSLRTGQVVFYRCDDEVMEAHGPGLALDAALSFAESMGFLFDDDPLEAGGDPEEAARSWTDLLDGVVEPPAPTALALAPETAPAVSEEILLDEVAMPEESAGLDPVACADEGVAPAPPLRLTKFRPRGGRPPAGPDPVAPGPWIRLLSAF